MREDFNSNTGVNDDLLDVNHLAINEATALVENVEAILSLYETQGEMAVMLLRKIKMGKDLNILPFVR